LDFNGVDAMDEIQRFTKVKEAIDKLSGDKIRQEERFNTEKKQLEKLIEEITSKGYDPTKLNEIEKEKERALHETLDVLEKSVKELKDKLTALES
jgi:DNA repair exonuclease SbcCD ATPase subunit